MTITVTLLHTEGVVQVGDCFSMEGPGPRWQFWSQKMRPQIYVVTAVRASTLTAIMMSPWFRFRRWLGLHPIVVMVASLIFAAAASYGFARLGEPQSAWLWTHIL